MGNDYLRSIVNEVLDEKAKNIADRGLNNDDITEEINKMDIEGAMSQLINQSSEMTMSFFKEHMYEIALEEQAQNAKFMAHQEQIWWKCFAASQTMYVMAVEAAELYSKYVQEDIEESVRRAKQYTYLSLQHIHGRACQEFLEILCLMRNGFSDCAYARWRSMYELCCTGQFIIAQGEKIAQQYFLQSQAEDMPESNSKSYLWAKGAVFKNGSKQKWNFEEIQDYCECDKIWRKQYKLSCLVNHASPEGTFKRLANGKTLNIIHVGRSDYGITTPAEHSAISLQQITTMFICIFPNLDGLNRCRVISDWVEIIREMYFGAHNQAFGETIGEKKEK